MLYPYQLISEDRFTLPPGDGLPVTAYLLSGALRPFEPAV